MTYKQLIQPDLTVTGRSGYCLEMQENVWHSLHLYDYAEQAWNNNGPNHPGEQPPDACVPVYWTYYDTAANTEYGHIATWIPGRGVYSSTFNTAFGAEWYPSIQAMTDRINKIPNSGGKYLGWSEVIANIKVVEGDYMDTPTDQQKQDYFNTYLGYPPTANDLATYTTWKSLLDAVFLTALTISRQEVIDLKKQLASVAPNEPAQPLPNPNPLPSTTNAQPPTPANQEKVNIFVALWKAIFG